jgi:hypothetical protein
MVENLQIKIFLHCKAIMPTSNIFEAMHPDPDTDTDFDITHKKKKVNFRKVV